MPGARYSNNPDKLAGGVYLVGGPELSDERDCLCYLVVGQSARVLIDCGAGPSARRILDLSERAGGGPPSHLLLTHAHIDHAGGAAELKSLTGCRVLIHQAEAEVLESGDVERSAAAWYGLSLDPVAVDQILTGDGSIPLGGGEELHLIHTPGHTPGSLAAWCERDSEKILFGQDIHGPCPSSARIWTSGPGAWPVSWSWRPTSWPRATTASSGRPPGSGPSSRGTWPPRAG